MFLSTLDLDWRRHGCGWVESADGCLRAVARRVGGCDHLVSCDVRRSASGNGFHVRLLCGIPCSICRLVFDSPRRLEADQGRPYYSRDVLWGSKVYRKGGRWVRLEAGEWRGVSDPETVGLESHHSPLTSLPAS